MSTAVNHLSQLLGSGLETYDALHPYTRFLLVTWVLIVIVSFFAVIFWLSNWKTIVEVYQNPELFSLSRDAAKIAHINVGIDVKVATAQKKADELAEQMAGAPTASDGKPVSAQRHESPTLAPISSMQTPSRSLRNRSESNPIPTPPRFGSLNEYKQTGGKETSKVGDVLSNINESNSARDPLPAQTAVHTVDTTHVAAAKQMQKPATSSIAASSPSIAANPIVHATSVVRSPEYSSDFLDGDENAVQRVPPCPSPLEETNTNPIRPHITLWKGARPRNETSAFSPTSLLRTPELFPLRSLNSDEGKFDEIAKSIDGILGPVNPKYLSQRDQESYASAKSNNEAASVKSPQVRIDGDISVQQQGVPACNVTLLDSDMQQMQQLSLPPEQENLMGEHMSVRDGATFSNNPESQYFTETDAINDSGEMRGCIQLESPAPLCISRGSSPISGHAGQESPCSEGADTPDSTRSLRITGVRVKPMAHPSIVMTSSEVTNLFYALNNQESESSQRNISETSSFSKED